MTFTYIVYTPTLEHTVFLQEVDDLIGILKKNDVNRINICFGWSWNDEWESFDISPHELMTEIRKQEKKTECTLTGNDVLILIEEPETEITLCHESDIHLEFNQPNKLVSEILNSWQTRGLIHCVRKDKKDIALSSVFL